MLILFERTMVAIMTYVCNEQHKEITNLRDMIDDELNRIAITDDLNEINVMTEYLVKNIQKYAAKNSDRVKGIFNPDVIKGGNLKL